MKLERFKIQRSGPNKVLYGKWVPRRTELHTQPLGGVLIEIVLKEFSLFGHDVLYGDVGHGQRLLCL